MIWKTFWMIAASFVCVAVIALAAAGIIANANAGTEVPYDEKQGYSLRVKLPAELAADDESLVAITDADGAHLFRQRADEAAQHADIYTEPARQQQIDSHLNNKVRMRRPDWADETTRMAEGRMEQTVPRELPEQSRTCELMIAVTSETEWSEARDRELAQYREPPLRELLTVQTLHARDFGVEPNTGLNQRWAIQKALDALANHEEAVELRFESGRYLLDGPVAEQGEQNNLAASLTHEPVMEAHRGFYQDFKSRVQLTPRAREEWEKAGLI